MRDNTKGDASFSRVCRCLVRVNPNLTSYSCMTFQCSTRMGPFKAGRGEGEGGQGGEDASQFESPLKASSAPLA